MRRWFGLLGFEKGSLSPWRNRSIGAATVAFVVVIPMARLIAIAFSILILPGASEILGAEVIMQWRTVGDAGNACDGSGDEGPGCVAQVYQISAFEVTNAQYAEFLNAVADSDPNGLYHVDMAGGFSDSGGILRSGTSGSYSYAVRPGRQANPVVYVSWYDALRFANWMHNGQPVGTQNGFTTEDGAYDMSPPPGPAVRKPGARVFLPSENEWYKAAFYKGGSTNAGYWTFATRTLGESSAAPRAEPPPGGVNSANWNLAVGGPPGTNPLTNVGAYPRSVSAYGTHDQNGNVSEWNEFWFEVTPGARGAFWGDNNWLNLASFGSGNSDVGPNLNAWIFGFRVARVGFGCCDPAEEPGVGGNPRCIEGHTCCNSGVWGCDHGSGAPSCIEGRVCFSFDIDADGVPTQSDNCPCSSNLSQCDSDSDRRGNHCDSDFNNDNVVGIPDFNMLRGCFGRTLGQPGFNAECDLNCDGAVGIPDFNTFRSFFGRVPGSECP